MDDNQLLRYSRQILLPQIGVEGQQKLLDSRALIIGMGGLGSPVAMYLAAAGVGHLVICDHDRVDLANLQRQIAHRSEDIGRLKVESACDTLRALNPLVAVTPIERPLTGKALLEEVGYADVVIDACDNFATRFTLNEACVRSATPLVSGATIRMEGQVMVFRPDRKESPCYACLYRDEPEFVETCTQIGVLAPLVGIIGSVQALEAIKVLLDFGTSLCGRVLLLDGMSLEWREVKLPKDPKCPVCGKSKD
jgi:Dinucleotide-utilizing enzymes involved in molybdopterin and thiamine biosynthesis family 2